MAENTRNDWKEQRNVLKNNNKKKGKAYYMYACMCVCKYGMFEHIVVVDMLLNSIDFEFDF